MSDGELSCELPGGGHVLFTSRAGRQPVEARGGEGAEHGRARSGAPVRAPRPAVAVREPPGPRGGRAARRLGPRHRWRGRRDRGRRPGDRASGTRDDGAHGRLPAGRARFARAPSRCSTPAGAASPRACSRRGCVRCKSWAAADEIVAVIGPGAGVCCYEVGPEVHAAFGGAHRRRPHRPARDRPRAPARGGRGGGARRGRRARSATSASSRTGAKARAPGARRAWRG